MSSLGRRQFLKAAALTAASAGVAASSCVIADDAIRTERVELVVPGLDPAHDGLLVVQLSDIHVGPLTPAARIRSAIATANDLAPDLVVLTGDYVTGSGVQRLRSKPGEVLEQAGGLAPPTVAVLGNHDHWVDPLGTAEALGRLGYCVLRNQNTTLSLRRAPFTIIGIDDHSTRNADPLRAMRGATGSRLFLAHDPLTSDMLRYLGARAVLLSGHTHGGQVNVPPISTLLPLRYRAGPYRVGTVRLYVNRGIGDTWVPLRVRAGPEVTLLRLRAPSAPAGAVRAGP